MIQRMYPLLRGDGGNDGISYGDALAVQSTY